MQKTNEITVPNLTVSMRSVLYVDNLWQVFILLFITDTLSVGPLNYLGRNQFIEKKYCESTDNKDCDQLYTLKVRFTPLEAINSPSLRMSSATIPLRKGIDTYRTGEEGTGALSFCILLR